MNYIQNKLDFEHFLMDKFPFHSNNSNEAFEKWLVDMDIDAILSYADEYKNKSLTDYHNHIVEKVKNYNADGFNGNDQSMIIKVDLIEYLQDTNPSGEYEKALDNHFPGIQDSLDKLTIRDTNPKE